MAIVISDMHGTYPPAWGPADIVNMKPLFMAEASIAGALGAASGKRGYLRTLDFAGHWRRFTEKMTSIDNLPGYPYDLPWKRGYRYSTPGAQSK
jgi:hypothetical protein